MFGQIDEEHLKLLPIGANREVGSKVVDSISNIQKNTLLHEKLAIVDSSTSKYQSDSLTQKFRSLKAKQMSSIDSSSDAVQKKFSILNSSIPKSQKLDSLTDIVNNANSTISISDSVLRLQENVKARIPNTKETSKYTDAINQKQTILHSESNGMGTTPGHVKVQELDIDAPPLDIDEVTNSLPIDVDKELILENVMNINHGLRLDEKKIAIPLTEKLKDVDLSSNKIELPVTEIDGVNLDKVKTLDLKEIPSADAEELMENRLSAETSLIKEHDSFISDKEQMTKKLRENYKQETLKRAREVVGEYMQAYNSAIQQKVSQVSTYHKKAGTVLARSGDLPSKRDPLRKLKGKERFVPIGIIALQKTNGVSIDINPATRYRLTSYWSVGTGWVERLGNLPRFESNVRIYGLRTFTEVVIFKGVSARIEYERLHGLIADRSFTERKSDWVSVCNAGLKKDFNFLPRVLGSVLFSYEIISTHNHLFYPSRFNVRFGFEPLKWKLKKSNEDRSTN